MRTRNENLNFINIKHIIKENSKNKPEPLTSKTEYLKKTHEIFRSTDLLLSAETLTHVRSYDITGLSSKPT